MQKCVSPSKLRRHRPPGFFPPSSASASLPEGHLTKLSKFGQVTQKRRGIREVENSGERKRAISNGWENRLDSLEWRGWLVGWLAGWFWPESSFACWRRRPEKRRENWISQAKRMRS